MKLRFTLASHAGWIDHCWGTYMWICIDISHGDKALSYVRTYVYSKIGLLMWNESQAMYNALHLILLQNTISLLQ